MRSAVRVALSAGREVELRAVEDADEAFILDTAATMPGLRATALVERCLTDGADAAPALTIGDRETLLLHLRRLRFGEPMDCVLQCPSPSCGERLEFRINVADLLLPPLDAQADGLAPPIVVDAGGARFTVAFHPPAADDVDRVAALASTDAHAAARAIFERCIDRAERDGAVVSASDLPPSVRDAVEAAMAAVDPQSEVQLAMRCPACGAEFSSIFDTATFFFRELDERASRTVRDAHLLAEHYHWSEADILRLPARRRAQYLELVYEARARRSK